MAHDWEDSAFTTFKWSLVQATKQRFDPRKYAAWLFANYLKGGQGPGALTGAALAHFQAAAKAGRPVEVPEYHGVFDVEPKPVQAAEEPEPDRTPPPPDHARQPPPPPDNVRPNPPPPPPDHGRPNPPPPPPPDSKHTQHPVKPPATAQNPPTVDAGRPDHWLPPGTINMPKGTRYESIWPRLKTAADSYLGTPYVWGGLTHKGIDCSGFTHNAFQDVSIGIPRVSKDQWKTGSPVERDQIRKGDLVFFDTLGSGVSHVGMVVDVKGQDPVVENATCSKGVRNMPLSNKWLNGSFLGARRLVP
jgi:hypothetical protein